MNSWLRDSVIMIIKKKHQNLLFKLIYNTVMDDTKTDNSASKPNKTEGSKCGWSLDKMPEFQAVKKR